MFINFFLIKKKTIKIFLIIYNLKNSKLQILKLNLEKKLKKFIINKNFFKF